MKMRSFPPTASLVLLVAVLTPLWWVAGCAAPGYLLDAVLPQGEIPAVHVPEDRPTVVFVDDPHNALPQSPLRAALATSIQHNLTHHKSITQFVSSNRVEEARLNEPDFRTWPIDRVGRHVGVEQVLYVMVEQFRDRDSTGAYRPQAGVRVKLVDVETGKRIFPADDDLGHPVATTMFFRTQEDSRGTATVLSQTLARKSGEDVARLFHRYRPREVGSGWDD